MLPPKYRLRKGNDIGRVMRKGRFIRGGLFSSRVLGNELGHPRFAVLVGLKVSKLATVRNRIKRRVREAVRKRIMNLSARVDVVLLPRAAVLDAAAADIEREVEQFFETLSRLWVDDTVNS